MKNLTYALITGFFLLATPPYRGVCQEKKVALVSFSINRKIDTGGLGPAAKASAKLLSSITNLVDDPDFDLKPTLENFKERFFNEFAPKFPFSFLPEEEVIGNSEYMNYEVSDKIQAERLSIKEGYKPLVLSGLIGMRSKDLIEMSELFKGKADGVMSVDIYFQFSKAPMFTAKVWCWIAMSLWKNVEEGQKRVFFISEWGSSKGIIPAPGGIPLAKTEKMLKLCKEASDKLLADLSKKGQMKKIVKKAAKKL